MPLLSSLAALKKIVGCEKKNGKKIVTTNGCFDLLHIGHIRYLEQAKKKGDILIVGINSDASVRKLKGKNRPVTPEKDRAEIVAALRSVDYTFIFDEPDPIAFLKELKPRVHVKGGDYRLEQIIERETVEANGGKVVLVPMVPNRSTTRTLKRISKGE